MARQIAPAEPTIRVSVRCPEQMFNSIDPSPFYERDLDEGAERFILAWARDVPKDQQLKLEVTVAEPGPADGLQHIGEAVHQQFRRRSESASVELRQLFRRGRISTVIGLSFLAASVIVGDVVFHALGETHAARIIQEGLHLLGWVSTWKPIETYLYAWWPIVGDRRLYDRLNSMPVEVVGLSAQPNGTSGASRSELPRRQSSRQPPS
jgi:hypothetical protein